MPCVLALDQGTTSSRTIVFDDEGNVRASAQQEFRQRFPQPGWVEHDPEEIWSSQAATVAAAMAEAGVGVRDLGALGIANQRETTVVWERATGRPICNAIVWQDRRTAALCERLRREGHEPLVRERTGLVIDPYFSGAKLAWILENVPGARGRAERGELAFGTVDSWLVWKLTGGARHVTDVSNASRTMLFNIRTGDWDDELLGILGVPRPLLPELCASSGLVAEAAGASGAAVASFGPAPQAPAIKGLPIGGIVGDQQAALAGQACFRRGDAKCTYGTGCFLLVNTGDEPKASANRLLATVAWRMKDHFGGRLQYALEGSVFVGGAVVQWLRDGLGVIQRSPDVERLAASVPDSGGVMFVPAFAGLGAPHWDPSARGLIIGLTRGTTAAHICRAAVESIAYQVAELAEAMDADAGAASGLADGTGPRLGSTRGGEFRVDGGAAANDALLQFQADLLQRPVVRPAVLETTALGAAYMAGLAAGVWKSTDQIAALRRTSGRFDPAMPASEAAERLARWREAVERAKGWSQAAKEAEENRHAAG